MARPSGSRSLGVLVAGLKRAKPASCVAVADSGDETPVALTGQRGRYERAARSLLSLQAVQVRCLDADGAVAEVIVVGETPEELGGDGPRARDVPGEVERLVRIALDARDRDRGRDLEMMDSVIQAAVGVLKVAGDRLEKLDAQASLNQRKRERELDERASELAQLAAENMTGAAGTDTEADTALKELVAAVSGSRITTNKKKAEEAKA